MSKETKKVKGNIDWIAMIVPLAGVLTLLVLFLTMPDQSLLVLESIRGFLGNDIGLYYILLGLFTLGATMYMAFSRFGKIKLGNLDKPQYSSFAWGSMIFTGTMAADIIFFSLSEWAMYAAEPHVQEMGSMQVWAPTFPLFHWGPIAWSIYIVLAVAFGFMLHIRGETKQKFSQACRPLLGNKVDGPLGKLIDVIAIFALIAGTATTFSLATPLISAAAADIFNISVTTTMTILILVMVAAIYTITVLFGIKGIKRLASICVYFFFALLFYFLFLGGETMYILETGVSSIGNLAQNFIGMATWTDPLRENSFAQDWTVFYWAYWMAWCVATPFFIGMISKGRTIRNTVVGAYGWGLAGTFTSFIILGNYGLAQQMRHGLDSAGAIAGGADISQTIIEIFHTLPLPTIALILLAINMIMFYSTTFDVLTIIVAGYSHKELKTDEEPDKRIRAFWAILLILLPIGLLFAEGTLANLQSVAIIAAFPIGIVIIMIVASFFKDAKKYLDKGK
ncbi:MAG: BCCT family transporter [Oscillospiraceae bacterium]|nr:BCCT family transporter [Oscillospiraceae bacterium]